MPDSTSTEIVETERRLPARGDDSTVPDLDEETLEDHIVRSVN